MITRVAWPSQDPARRATSVPKRKRAPSGPHLGPIWAPSPAPRVPKRRRPSLNATIAHGVLAKGWADVSGLRIANTAAPLSC